MTAPTRPAIAESVLDLIGKTPLVRLSKLGPANGATVYG
jgi:cysteine synthase